MAGTNGLNKLKVVRSEVPAITHVDYSARVQTVDEQRHGRLYRLMKIFRRAFGLPGADQYLVQRSRRADRCATLSMPTDASWAPNMDVLVMENHLLLKDEQTGARDITTDDYLAQFQLD